MTKTAEIEKVDAFFNVDQDDKKEQKDDKVGKNDHDGFYMIVEMVRTRCPFNPFAQFIDNDRTYFIKVEEFDNISDVDAKDGMDCMQENFKSCYLMLSASKTESIRRVDNTWYHEARAYLSGSCSDHVETTRTLIHAIVGQEPEKTKDHWSPYVTLGTFEKITDAREMVDAFNSTKEKNYCRVISFTTKRPTL